MKEFEKCNCGNIATWWYAPASDREYGNRYYCDNCVHRGCSCNHRYVDVDAYHPPLDNPDIPTEKDKPWIWIEEGKIWTNVDSKGREYPCCEYFYEEEGFEKEN